MQTIRYDVIEEYNVDSRAECDHQYKRVLACFVVLMFHGSSNIAERTSSRNFVCFGPPSGGNVICRHQKADSHP